jgi:hypothetical protein
VLSASLTCSALESRFFSYLHSVPSQPRNIIEHAAAKLLRLAPPSHPARLATTRVEWWAHCRPHCSGHTLHFDSDDADAQRGVLTCPLLSAVIYLSEESVGGPTLVTDQCYAGPLGERGWLIMPKPNRAILFAGSRLHGVVPGCGPHSHADSARRITVLFAFWQRKDFGGPADAAASERTLRSTRKKGAWQGVCAPVPAAGSSALWPQLLHCDSATVWLRTASLPVPVQPVIVTPVWTICATAKGRSCTSKPGYPSSSELQVNQNPPFRHCFQGF